MTRCQTSIYLDDAGRLTTVKSAGATLDYAFDWSAWLGDVDDTALSYEFSSVGVAIESSGELGGVPYAVVSGGVPNGDNSLTCTVTTPFRVYPYTLYFDIPGV